MNKTDIPCGDEVGQIKPILRFSSRNFFRASYSDAKREDFSFSFAENVSKFIIFRKNIGKVRSFYKFCKVSLNIQRMKIKFKVARAWKF